MGCMRGLFLDGVECDRLRGRHVVCTHVFSRGLGPEGLENGVPLQQHDAKPVRALLDFL